MTVEDATLSAASAAQATVSSGYVLAGPRTLRFEAQDLPELPADWVRLRFLYCGLCGSDITHFESRQGSYPVSVGHEFVAEVTAVGVDVEAFSPGDIVTSDLNYRCGACDHCLAGRSHLCRDGQQGLFTNRAFSDIGDIHFSYLLRFDSPVRRHLTLTEPLSCVLHAKQWAQLTGSERILVIGAGSIGLCMAFALCHQAPARSFDITDLMPSRLSSIEKVIAPIGRGVAEPEGTYDVVFDLSGTESGLSVACDRVRAGGRICSMSHPNGDPVSPFFIGRILRHDITFTVSYLNGEPVVLREAAWLLERHWSDAWDSLIKVLPLDRLQEAYEQRRTAPWCKTVIDVVGECG
jgi:L-iditol 2-dehydrogenase